MFLKRNYLSIFEPTIEIGVLCSLKFDRRPTNGAGYNSFTYPHSMRKDIDMQNNESIEQKRPKKRWNFGYIFSLIMLVIYFGMAYLLVFSELFVAKFGVTMRYIFAVIFAIYAIFRSYRIIQDFKNLSK